MRLRRRSGLPADAESAASPPTARRAPSPSPATTTGAVLAADSDGVDGASEAAGAFFDGDTPARFGDGTNNLLEENDSATLFHALDDQLVTGHTGTNVNDLRIILVGH